MGPLAPDIIGNDLNLIAGLFIGILFGVILEQAGFSTSKKLVGLFYGYDFTVLRVFFTAGIVAMTGVIAFDHFGLLDINLTYINPTFLWSAIVGGLIMGLGFVVGGFCPGTSICAAAIGKIDAMLFIVGSLFGVLIFAEGYPLFEGLYKAENWGNVRIFQTLNMSQSLFAFLLTLTAVGAFWITSVIENKVNKISKPVFRFTPYYISLAAAGIVIALSAFLLPERKPDLIAKSEDAGIINSFEVKKITSDELAFRIMDKDDKLQIIDFRPLKEFEKFSLPKSVSFTVDNLFEKEPSKILSYRHKIYIFVANDEVTEKKFAFIAGKIGFNNIRMLQGGLNEFKNLIINNSISKTSDNRLNTDTNRFRAEAAKAIPELIAQNKNTGTVKKSLKRVTGGC